MGRPWLDTKKDFPQESGGPRELRWALGVSGRWVLRFGSPVVPSQGICVPQMSRAWDLERQLSLGPSLSPWPEGAVPNLDIPPPPAAKHTVLSGLASAIRAPEGCVLNAYEDIE